MIHTHECSCDEFEPSGCDAPLFFSSVVNVMLERSKEDLIPNTDVQLENISVNEHNDLSSHVFICLIATASSLPHPRVSPAELECNKVSQTCCY